MRCVKLILSLIPVLLAGACATPPPLPPEQPLAAVYSAGMGEPSPHRLGSGVERVFALYASRDGLDVSAEEVELWEGAVFLEKGRMYYTHGCNGTDRGKIFVDNTVEPRDLRFSADRGHLEEEGVYTPPADQGWAARHGFEISVAPRSDSSVRSRHLYRPLFAGNKVLRFDGKEGAHGAKGDHGRDGEDGREGEDGNEGGAGRRGEDGGDGGRGEEGGRGYRGGDGRPGQDAPDLRVGVAPLKSPFYREALVEVTVKSSRGPEELRVIEQTQQFRVTADGGEGGDAGRGGRGGHGGAGGRGGDGGEGGDGRDGVEDRRGEDGGDGGHGGDGGNGGDAGDGGRGGSGGRGGDGGVIHVSYRGPAAFYQAVRGNIDFSCRGGDGGRRGAGGPGGNGGRAGWAGSGGEGGDGGENGGEDGQDGDPGERGQSGQDGAKGPPGRRDGRRGDDGRVRLRHP